GGGTLLHELGAHPAEAVLPLDADGVARRFDYSFSGLQSFAVVTAEAATGHRVPRSRFEHGSLPIDFIGPPETVASVSYSKVLAGKFPANLIAGKIAIVGA